MVTTMLDRGTPVSWSGGTGIVVSDVGDATVVVRREDGGAFRVAREDLVTIDRPKPDLWGFVVDAHFCALQRQSNPPTKTEMVDGAWTLCGKWVSSRSAPTKGPVTCATCVTRAEVFK